MVNPRSKRSEAARRAAARAGRGDLSSKNIFRAIVILFPVVYILASQRNGTLNIGVTSDLVERIAVHKDALLPGLTRLYGVDRLVYFESHETMLEAIAREKQLKKWPRARKIALFEQFNPEWRDMFMEIAGLGEPIIIRRLV